MSYYPPKPVQFVLTGDTVLGNEFLPQGRKLAGKLNQQMSRGNLSKGYGAGVNGALDTGRIGPEEHRGRYGVVTIEAYITFNVTYVRIHAIPAEAGGVTRKPLYPQMFPCFILAKIEKVSCRDGDISVGSSSCVMDTWARSRGRFWYDVSFFYEEGYFLLEDYWITSAGCGIYNKGQYVLLGPPAIYDEEGEFDCCVDKSPLVDWVLKPTSEKMLNGYLDVYPLHILGGMKMQKIIYE